MNTKKSNISEYGYFILAGMTWGTIGLFVKVLEQAGSTSAYTTFLRLTFACILMVLLTLIKDGINAFRVDRKTLIACFLTGLVCQLIYNLVYSTAVARIGVGCASVLLYISPFFTACASAILFREIITKRKWCVLAIDVLGCGLTAGILRMNTDIDWIGILLGVAAGFCYAMVPIFGKIASGRAKPMAVTTYTFLFSVPLISLLQPWSGVINPLSIDLLLPGFLYGLIPTAFAYVLYYIGIEKISEPSRIPVLCSIEPVIAIMIGVVLFNENLYFDTILGIAMVLTSIFLMNKKINN